MRLLSLDHIEDLPRLHLLDLLDHLRGIAGRRNALQNTVGLEIALCDFEGFSGVKRPAKQRAVAREDDARKLFDGPLLIVFLDGRNASHLAAYQLDLFVFELLKHVSGRLRADHDEKRRQFLSTRKRVVDARHNAYLFSVSPIQSLRDTPILAGF